LKLVIAGAAGFVGKLLLDQLPRSYDIVALTRSSAKPDPTRPNVTWRSCDLFSLLQTERALEGADIAIYLVHSMLPKARLTQSSFEDADLLLADNFGRAAKKAGIKKIIYLGGLIPPSTDLSPHLLSRLEVEKALGSQEVPVISLRAGLILGAKGSSFQMLYLLVKRLPVMICPRWTLSRTQPIASNDVVNLIRFCLTPEAPSSGSFDIGGPDVLTYQQLMKVVADEL
jgi:uncharacterized protein YbjT (DUF2867 family)